MSRFFRYFFAVILVLSCASSQQKKEHLQHVLESSVNYHIEKGMAAADSNRMDIAMEHLQKAAEIVPYDPVIYNNLGVAYLRLGLVDSAITAYQSAIRMRPTYAHAYSNLAQAYLIKEDYSLAIVSIETAFKYDDQIPEAYIILAMIYGKLGENEKSISAYEKAVEIQPENKMARINLGALYYSKGLINESIEQFSAAIEIAPESNVAHFNLGNAYARKCQLDDAITQYTFALDLKNDMYTARNNRGLVYMYLESYNEAILDFKAVLKDRPNEVSALFNLSVAMERLDSLECGLQYIDQALSVDQQVALLYFQKGNLLMKLEQPEQALVNFQHAINLDSSFAFSYNNLGNALLKTSNVQEAKKAYTKAVELYPDYLEQRYFTHGKSIKQGLANLLGGCDESSDIAYDFAMVYSNLGQSLYKLGQLDHAHDAFKKAVKLAPENTAIYLHLSRVLDQKGEREKAKTALATSLLNQAKIYFDKDSLTKAEDLCNKSLKVKSDFPEAFVLMASIAVKYGNSTRAKSSFEKAMKYGAESGSFHVAYGDFLQSQNQNQQALFHYQKAVDKQPSDYSTREKLANLLTKLNMTAEANKQRAILHYFRGKNLEYLGQWDKALDEFTQASEIESENSNYIASQGLIYVRKHLNKEAQVFLDKSLQLDKENILALYGKALILGDEQEHQKAIELLTFILDKDPSFSEAHYAISVNYFFLGQYEKAWTHVQQAQQLGMIINSTFIQELEESQN